MCGLVGYVGKNLSRDYILQGLSRLEYRGYDSAGFACLNINDKRLAYEKSHGHLSNLIEQLKKHPINGHIGLGHTRWSTHGSASQENAHPHFDCYNTISVAHNGIIENHHALKSELLSAGHSFRSQTDTEVVAHVLEDILSSLPILPHAIHALVQKLAGAYALVCLLQQFPEHIVAIRKGSPLCIGIGDEEFFIASDPVAFAGLAHKVIYLPEETYAIINHTDLRLYNFRGLEVVPELLPLNTTWNGSEKNGYEHFMLKEIFEQKGAIQASVSFWENNGAAMWEQLGLTTDQLMHLDSATFIGCGTSWHAALIGKFFFQHVALMPVTVALASEFRYESFFPAKNHLYLLITQSGETADTLESLRLVNRMHLPTVALTNVASSSAVREADGFLLTHAGYEIAVASTKAFATQLAGLYWLAHRIALQKKCITAAYMESALDELWKAAEVLENTILLYKDKIINRIAPFLSEYAHCLFLGRHISYPFALEGALKLKEISYIFAQAYPSGELKHGPIALIDEHMPLIVFSVVDPLIYQKLLSNVQEVKARAGKLIVFAFEGQTELIQLADEVIILPLVEHLLGPLAMTGIMQFLVYQVAKLRNLPIDKPRNLAKSVTVE